MSICFKEKSMGLNQMIDELKSLADPEKARVHQRFFKTRPGEYGEGDLFYGVKVPDIRKIAKKYGNIPYEDIEKLICSQIHEKRFLALIILLNMLAKKRCSMAEQKKIFDFYIMHRKYVNNWDLVDLSAPGIAGRWLMDKNKQVLYDFAMSQDLWERRIAIIGTFYFIKKNEFEHTIKLSKILVKDKEDLIHKAVGWMLREVGKRDMGEEEKFLKTNLDQMPRTMLRYAIEKFPENLRQKYLNGGIV